MSRKLNKKLLEAKTVEETKEALAAGADVNAKDEFGQTVLIYAIQDNNVELVKILIDNGADVNVRDKWSDTALMYAKTAEITKLLIAAGANVNAKNKWTKTVLMCAKTAEQTKLLIAAGADVNAKVFLDITALDMAIMGGYSYKETVEILLEAKHKLQHKLTETKERIKSTPRLKGISGVVVADKIAEMKRSGIIKGDITPEMGKMLRIKIVRDHVMNTKR